MTRRVVVVLLIIGALAASLRLWHLVSLRGTPLYQFDEIWQASDMRSNRAWGEHLAAGDWLDRNAWRPSFDWMAGVADPPTWNRWLGTTTYYQPPLYSYLLALGIRATGSPGAFRILQALLGGVNAILIGLLAARLVSPMAGILAAAIIAIYAPFILYDAELLRGTLVVALDSLALLALLAAGDATDGKDAGRARRKWIVAGALLGAAYLADSAVITFLPLAMAWGVWRTGGRQGERRAGLRDLGWLAAGLAAALLPLALRNVAVGAPILSTTTRAPLAFVMGNAPDAQPVGAVIPPSAGDLLHESDYGTWATIRATIGAYHGHLGGLIGKQWTKLVGLFNSYEVPDNPSFDYVALRSPILRWGLRFACISGLGLIGLILAARRWRDHLLMYLFLASMLGLFVLAHVVSRYRQPLVIVLAVYAAMAITEAVRYARERKLAAAGGIMAAALLVSFALPRTPPPGYRLHRSAEFIVVAAKYEQDGDVNHAAAEVKQAIAFADKENAPDDERYYLGNELGELYRRHERFPEALAAFRDVLDDDPRNRSALVASGGILQDTRQPMEALSMLLRAENTDPNNVEVHYRLGYLYWRTFKDGPKALPHLRRALELAPNGPAAADISALSTEISKATGINP